MDGPSSSGPKSVVSFVESGWVKLALFHGSINWSKGVGFHKESIMLNQYSILFNFKPPKTIDLSCIFLITTWVHIVLQTFFSPTNNLSRTRYQIWFYHYRFISHFTQTQLFIGSRLFYFHFGICLIEEEIKGLTFWTTKTWCVPWNLFD